MLNEFIKGIKYFKMTTADEKKISSVIRNLKKRYEDNSDPWGLDLGFIEKFYHIMFPLYRKYFQVKVHGKSNVGQKQYMVVSNHSGQIAVDGLLISMAFALEMRNPRMLRAMVERFVSAMPFIGDMMSRYGSVLGERKNCEWLLKRDESVLIFPEGIKGVAKDTKDFYKLKPFTKGFFRLALAHDVDILPVAVVGAEEFYPYVKHFRSLAKLMKLPIFPVTPLFPFLGPLGLLPMPSPVDIYIGKPYTIPKKLSHNAIDSLVDNHIKNIRTDIKSMLKEGLSKRRTSPLFDKLGIDVKRSL